MNTMHFTEETYEKALIQLFQDLGYTYKSGAEVERDPHEPYYREELEKQVRRINPGIPQEAIDEALQRLMNDTYAPDGSIRPVKYLELEWLNKPMIYRRCEDVESSFDLMASFELESEAQVQAYLDHPLTEKLRGKILEHVADKATFNHY